MSKSKVRLLSEDGGPSHGLSFSFLFSYRLTRGAGAGTKLKNMSIAQIVISTTSHESQTLAFNYASLALNNSFFLHHLVSPLH